MRQLSIIICAAMLFFACGQRGNSKNNAAKAEPGFRMPTPPAMITGERERAEWIAMHYWDNFDFADTTLVGNAEVTEQAFTDFVVFAPRLPQDKMEALVRTTMARAEADSAMFRYFIDLAEKYLYDPGSPYRNDEVYIPFLEYILASDKLDEYEKLRPASQLEMARLNRIGRRANDFTYTLADGRRQRLYDIKADYTLVYMYNPDCTACAEIRAQIIASPMLHDLISSGRMKVAAVYPDGDLAAWKAHLGEIPKEWLNGYDHTMLLRNGKIYNLKAIPSMYLLDRDKTVLLKDADNAGIIERYIYEHDRAR